MIITIDNKKNKLVNIEGFRFKKYYFNRYKAYFFGNFRTPLDVIEKIILSDSKVFLDNKVFKLFKHIHGDMTLVISDDNEVKIFSSIYNSTLKIFKNENNFHITNNEFFEKKKKLSENLSFLKLFSHHSFFIPQGLSENCYDFMLPGSILTFRRNNIGHYDLSWYLKFEEFCSRDDHDQIVRDLSESFQDQFNFKHDKLKTKIALSGGLDSATVLAATKSYQDISAFTYAKLFDPQLWTAKNVVKKLNKKLQIKYFYSGPYSDITFKTDIRDLLNFSYRYISKDSVPFFLNNSTIISKYNFNNHLILDGNSFPTALTIKHSMKYPTRRNYEMNYSTFKDLRFNFSIENLRKLKEKKLNFKKLFFEESIHEYYQSILLTLITQKQGELGNILSNLSTDFSSPVENLTSEQQKILNDLSGNILVKIISKLLKSNFFSKELKSPNERVAQILLKTLLLFSGIAKSMHQDICANDENYINQAIGLNPNILLKLLSVKIDEKLVNHSKWHIFETFKILSGEDFDNSFFRGSHKNPIYVSKLIMNKIFYKFSSFPEDQRYALINNRYLEKFIKEKEIIEKYINYKKSHPLKDLMYNFPSKDEIRNVSLFNQNFWKINNTINIVSKIET